MTENNRSNNGQFAPGNPGKQKGSSKNLMRDQIKKFISDHWQDMPVWFAGLKPKEKIDVMLALLPYSVSRLQSVSMTDSQGEDLSEPKAFIDYSQLSQGTLTEILKHTTINNEND